jgi:hypothetical protein
MPEINLINHNLMEIVFGLSLVAIFAVPAAFVIIAMQLWWKHRR